MSDEKYEYVVIEYNPDNTDTRYNPTLQAQIDHLAKQGFRVVSSGGAGQGTQGYSSFYFTVIMERRVS